MKRVSTTISRLKTLRLNPPLIALLLATAIFILGGVLNRNFATYDQAMNILRVAAFLGIVAAGQTLVIISGGEGIDLSVGTVVTLGALLVYRLSNGMNEMIVPMLLVALAAGAGVGLLNGIGIAFLRIPPLVMTLGMAGVVQGLIQAITQGRMEGATPPLMKQLLTSRLVLGIPGTVLVWLLLGVGMWFLLERTGYGKRLFAIGVNRTTARLSGVRATNIVIITYVLSGALAAFGGFVLLGYTERVFLSLGDDYTLPSVAAVVVGGTLLAGGIGSYTGTMAGALVLTVLTSFLTAQHYEAFVRPIVYGFTLLVLLFAYGRQRKLRA